MAVDLQSGWPWICSLAGRDAAVQLFTSTQTILYYASVKMHAFIHKSMQAGVLGKDPLNRRPCM